MARDNRQQGPFGIAIFHDFVPYHVRFTLLLLFAVAFQFSSGVYLAGVNQVVGGKTLLEEDIRMAGYMAFIGLTVTFPLVFRIKFRFKARDIIIGSAAGIAVCNIITMYTGNVVVLMGASFITGILRLTGTFTCMSTIQPRIAPTRNQTVFFCILFAIILSSIQLSGITSVYLDYFYNWQYMHVFIIGLMMLVMLCALFLMKDLRLMKKLPLYGIDWPGLALWSVFLISATFTLQYGKYFDWFDSVYIRIGTVAWVASLLLAVRHMLTARRPYINPEIFRYRNVKSGLLLILAMMFLLATPNTIQGTLTSGILNYDSLNSISLNWLVFAGVAVGAVLAWYGLVVRRMRHKWVIFCGFLCLAAYQATLYFILDPGINIELLYYPSFIRGVGYSILYVSLTVYFMEYIPFKYFLQPMGVISLVRMVIGSVAGASLLSNWMTYLVKKNNMLLGWQLDAVNPDAAGVPVGTLYGEVTRQAMLVSMKEILGWFTIGGLVVLLFILTMKYMRPIVRIMPKMKTYRRYLRGRNRTNDVNAVKTPRFIPEAILYHKRN